MVALDHRRVACAGFDHIGVDGTLDQIIHGADFFALFLKDPDEFLADGLSLGLRLLQTRETAQEPPLRVHPDKPDGPLGEGRLHLVPLILPHEAVIHKNAGELTSHSLRQEGGGHRGIHTSGQGQEHLAVPYGLPDVGNGRFAEILHGPVAHSAAHPI